MKTIERATKTSLAAGTFSRTRIAKFMDRFSAEQLNAVPTGLAHNIIWNVGHILAAQQLFTYRRAGLPLLLPDDFIESYKSGSPVRTEVSADEIEQIREFLFSTHEQLESDYENDAFRNFAPFESRTGVNFKTIEDAIAFHSFHEGVHLGWIISIARTL